MAQVVLLTGGNLGPVAQNLSTAREALEQCVGPIIRASSVRESDAWGFEAKERFLNQVLILTTTLEPEQVLTCCQHIEQRLGRHRKPNSGYTSRTLDIDILFYDNRILDTEQLTLPHPRIAEREFVLAPLEEVLPDYIHPIWGKTIRQLHHELAATHDTPRSM